MGRIEPAPLSALVQNKVDAAHAAAAAGQVAKLESALGAGRASQGGGAAARLPLAMCKDRAGAGLLHKAVFRSQRAVVDWLLGNHPGCVQLKDRVSTRVHETDTNPQTLKRYLPRNLHNSSGAYMDAAW